jgi:signal transduction histidine kinase/ActR/RegA family two-component response regulator
MPPLATAAPTPSRDTPSGLPAIARLGWGTHLCQFFRTADDLATTLVPYFATGLEQGERCLWITSEPFRSSAALAALARVVPDLDARVARGDLEVIDHENWYLRYGRLTTDEVLAQWLERERAALRDGYAGLRISGNTRWLGRESWQAFSDYEARVHRAFHDRRLVCVCSYALDRCSTDDILDVLRSHGTALARRDGRWEVLRSATETLEVVSDAHAGDHDVVFYEGGDFPVEQVAEFLAAGLRGGAGVMALLAADRAELVRAALARRAIDPAAAAAAGQLVWPDPEETLRALMEGDTVSAARFDAVVRAPLEALRDRFGSVRAYGEMVDVLCRRGDARAAVELERLWNAVLHRIGFPLLCTYGLEAFDSATGADRFGDVCGEHVRVLRPGGGADGAALQRIVTELEQKGRALRAEAERRASLEGERDRLASASARTGSHLHRLQRVTSALAAASTVDEIGAVIVTTMAEVLDAREAVLAAPLPDGGGLEAVAATPDAGRLLRAGGPVARAHAARAVLWPPPNCGPGAHEVALPLETRGRALGALGFLFAAARHLSAADRALLDDLARQAALSLDRARLLEQAERERARAEEANRAKDAFLAMLGHELRNPLAPIVTSLELMGLRGGTAYARERAVIERQVRHMARLVDDLLDVARVTRGRFELRREPVELSALVADAVETASPLLEERGHSLTLSVPPSGLVLDGDPQRLRQAVANLLTNAAKYTPRSGRIEVSAERAGDRVRLRVRDDGQGIEASLLPRIFDAFVQGERALDRSEGGLGLGLAIVRAIAEAHGGSALAESDGPGTGSTFTLELPLVAADGAATCAAARRAVVAAAGPRVLVVDDNDDSTYTLGEALRLAGCEVETAHDGPTALLVAERFRPEVAVLDIGLPAMDGWELARRLRALDPERPPALVAVTGYGLAGDHDRSREAGFDEHFVKPVELSRLTDAVRRHAPRRAS